MNNESNINDKRDLQNLFVATIVIATSLYLFFFGVFPFISSRWKSRSESRSVLREVEARLRDSAHITSEMEAELEIIRQEQIMKASKSDSVVFDESVPLFELKINHCPVPELKKAQPILKPHKTTRSIASASKSLFLPSNTLISDDERLAREMQLEDSAALVAEQDKEYFMSICEEIDSVTSKVQEESARISSLEMKKILIAELESKIPVSIEQIDEVCLALQFRVSNVPGLNSTIRKIFSKSGVVLIQKRFSVRASMQTLLDYVRLQVLRWEVEDGECREQQSNSSSFTIEEVSTVFPRLVLFPGSNSSDSFEDLGITKSAKIYILLSVVNI